MDTDLSSADESEGELAQNKEKERMESLQKLQGGNEGMFLVCFWASFSLRICISQARERSDGRGQRLRRSFRGQESDGLSLSQMLSSNSRRKRFV